MIRGFAVFVMVALLVGFAVGGWGVLIVVGFGVNFWTGVTLFVLPVFVLFGVLSRRGHRG